MPSNPTLILIPTWAAMARQTLLCNHDVTSTRAPYGVGVSRLLLRSRDWCTNERRRNNLYQIAGPRYKAVTYQ